jgi:hypothetical protein
MLNLNAGLILGDGSAYERAERTLWNALAFNQWITGGFGTRELTASGYGLHSLEEAWWCCVHNAGMGMSEYARHVVTYREGTIRVNFLVPGEYVLPLPDGKEAKAKIGTVYPARAEATIEFEGVPPEVDVAFRVPSCVRNANVTQSRGGDQVQLVFKGELGHRVERHPPGVVLTYGPLVLVPASYGFGSPPVTDASRHAPEGYVPESLPAGVPVLKLDRKADADGFVQLDPGPLPARTYWDEGPQSRTWVPGAVATVPMQISNGEVRQLRFTPICYNTSCLALFDTPVLLREG